MSAGTLRCEVRSYGARSCYFHPAWSSGDITWPSHRNFGHRTVTCLQTWQEGQDGTFVLLAYLYYLVPITQLHPPRNDPMFQANPEEAIPIHALDNGRPVQKAAEEGPPERKGEKKAKKKGKKGKEKEKKKKKTAWPLDNYIMRKSEPTLIWTLLITEPFRIRITALGSRTRFFGNSGDSLPFSFFLPILFWPLLQRPLNISALTRLNVTPSRKDIL